MKKRLICVFSALILLCALAVNAYAAETVDMSRTGSVSITMTHLGEPVSGGSLTLYRVADVTVENGADYSFRYTEEFAACEADLADLNSAETALALAEYVAAGEISGVKQTVSDVGEIRFEGLTLGLYLLVQEEAAEGFDTVNPFLVSVPGRENGSYVYEVNASPKLNLEPLPTEPPTEPPEPTLPPPDLPQTGLNKWPVPVLLGCGLLLVVVGVWLTVAGRKRGHEN